MFVTFELIAGVGFGIEVITKNQLDEGEGWYLIIELGIIRVIVDK